MRSTILKSCGLGAVGVLGWMFAVTACSDTTTQSLEAVRSPGAGQDPIVGITQEMLSPLATAPAFNSGTNTLTVTVAPGELALIGLQPVGSGAHPVIVNGVQAFDAAAGDAGATDASVQAISIVESGASSTQTTEVIIDYTNGLFATALAHSGGSVTLSLAGTEPTVFGVKGLSGSDNIVFGANGINVSSPYNVNGPDIVFAGAGSAANGGASAFVVSLGDGDDYFSAGGDLSSAAGSPGSAILGGAFSNLPTHGVPNFPAKGVEVFGGLGNDTVDETSASTPYETISLGGQSGDTVDYSARTAAVNVSLGILGAAGASPLSGNCPAAGSGGSCASNEFDDLSSDIMNVNGGAGDDYFTAFQVAVAGSGSSDAGASDAHSDAADAHSDAADAHADAADAGSVDAGSPAAGPGPTFVGNAGNNTFTPGPGTYTLTGGAGNDTFLMGDDSHLHGAGAVTGGGGVDTIDFSARTVAVHVTADGTTMSGSYNGTAVVENMTVGSDISNIKGGAGNDSLTGNALNNVIMGGAGADTIVGLAGQDTADYSDHTTAVWVSLDGIGHSGSSAHQVRTLGTAAHNYTDGSCTLTANTGLNNTGSDENDNVATDVENIIGGSGNDCLLGQPVSFSCTGTLCQNTLVGAGGNDMLFGFADNDVLDGAGGTSTEASGAANYLDCGDGSLNIGRDVGAGYKAITCQF